MKTLTITENHLLDIVTMTRFTASEKAKLVLSYLPVISDYALSVLTDRIKLIEGLKLLFKNQPGKD